MYSCTPIMFSSTISAWILDKISGYGCSFKCSFKLHRLPLKCLPRSPWLCLQFEERQWLCLISSCQTLYKVQPVIAQYLFPEWLAAREICICRVTNNEMKAQPVSCEQPERSPCNSPCEKFLLAPGDGKSSICPGNQQVLVFPITTLSCIQRKGEEDM